MVLKEAHEKDYPKLENLKRNYKDPDERVRWRSKQVIDYAVMAETGRALAKYFLQIEDDVISSMNLYKHIMDTVHRYHDKPWTILEFSVLGYIGKLFKSEDLGRFATFLRLFYYEQPVDWLFPYFFKLLTQKGPINIKPSLFQHFGQHSSFSPKTNKGLNKSKDKQFAHEDPLDHKDMEQLENRLQIQKVSSQSTHVNPEASISTTLQAYGNHRPQDAYDDTNNFFWANTPAINDTFTMKFQSPVKLNSLHIQTGNIEHSGDYAHSAVVEYSSETILGTKPCKHYQILKPLYEGSLHLTGVNISRPVTCLQLRLTGKQTDWLIIQTIKVN